MKVRGCWVAVLLSLVAIAASALVAGPASAQPASQGQGQGQDREVKARGLFAEGRYADALEIYVRLYADAPHPTYLRNIGRCYQNLEQPEKAISSFREYLRQVKNLSADQRATIEGYISEMEELRRRQQARAATASPPAAAADRTAPAHPPEATQARAAESRAPGAGASAGDGLRMRRTLALGLGALGVIGIGAGAWFGLDARSKWSQAKDACPSEASTGCNPASRQLGHDADRAAGFATIGFAAGAALLTGGVILWLISRERPGEAATASAHPRLAPRLIAGAGDGQVTGGLAGTF